MSPKMPVAEVVRAKRVAKWVTSLDCRTTFMKWKVVGTRTLSVEINHLECFMKIMMTIANLLVLILGTTGAKSQTMTDDYERLYQNWHQILSSAPALTEPMWFSTNGPKDLAIVVGEMQSNRIGMAYFLCNRMAAQQYTNMQVNGSSVFYRDLVLLDNLAGINLIFPDDRSEPFGKGMAENFNRFKADWLSGVYKDPSTRITAICEAQLAKENTNTIAPDDILALRRYGIFGLPALIKEIKQYNSKHAFAAFLIVTQQREKYASYIKNSNEQFPTPIDKLEDIRTKTDTMRAGGNDDFQLVARISDVLSH
jgi:hypothetical protein